MEVFSYPIHIFLVHVLCTCTCTSHVEYAMITVEARRLVALCIFKIQDSTAKDSLLFIHLPLILQLRIPTLSTSSLEPLLLEPVGPIDPVPPPAR